MKDESDKMLSRLSLTKDIDPFNTKLLNDCYHLIEKLQAEIDRLAYHNNNLMNVIYQNQSELEN